MSQAHVLQALLKSCARQDQTAFEQLYRLTSPKLFPVCRYLLRRESLAEEVLQEAFMQIWRDAYLFDPARSAPMTWLTSIVRHRALDTLRRQRPEDPWSDTEHDQAADLPGPMELVAGMADNQALKHCLEQLPEDQRHSIVQAFLSGLTHQQLSETLATPVGTVKSWIRRGLERLRRCLEP